jgi:hypothetical protein
MDSPICDWTFILQSNQANLSRIGQNQAASGLANQEATMEMLVILGGLIGLALAALRWGVDSTDTIDSQEWDRRRAAVGQSWLSAGKE